MAVLSGRSRRTPAARRAAASLLVVAATSGWLGLATFGRFDSAHDTMTRSVVAPVGVLAQP